MLNTPRRCPTLPGSDYPAGDESTSDHSISVKTHSATTNFPHSCLRAEKNDGKPESQDLIPHSPQTMLFFSFFKTLESKSVTIELKNDLRIKGILHSVDQYLNCKLQDVHVLNGEKHPQLMTVSSVFIRGSVVRYVHINPADVDVALLQDATRREYREGRNAP